MIVGMGMVVLRFTFTTGSRQIWSLCLNLNRKAEILWLKVSLPNTRPVLVGIVYGPKVCNEFFENLESVLGEISELSVASRTPAETLCIGDFNCDALKTAEWEWKKLRSIMCTHQLSQIINSPTRVTQFSESCIDHVWTSRPEMYVHNGVITFPFSDHSLVYAVRKSQRLVKGPSRNIKARSYCTFDANSFINDLRQVPWNTIEVSDNPDLAWSIFENQFIPICDNHALFKQMKIPNKSPPLFNDEYLHLRKELEQKIQGS